MANEQQGNYSVFRSIVDNNSTNLQPIPFPDFNETIRFNGNSLTYKELVYTSSIKETLNLSIEVLTNDSKTSRLAIRNERKGTKVVPRPQNSWIIYRRDKYADPEFEGVKSCDASVKIGEKWKSESNEVLEYFAALSMLALENHQKKYGGYKYQPKSRVNRIKKSKNRQRRIKENVENISPVTNNETTDLPQLTITPSSPTNEYPTPVSSITHSPVASQDDFSEQTNNNSYYMTPPSSNQHSPETFQDQNSHLLTNQDSDSSITLEAFLSMYPNLPSIASTTDFSTCNNNFSGFFHDADMLAAEPSQFSPNTTIPNIDFLGDFDLFPDNEIPMPNTPMPNTPMPNTLMPIILPAEEPTDIDQFFQNLIGCDNYDPFMATPFMDPLDFFDNNGHPVNE